MSAGLHVEKVSATASPAHSGACLHDSSNELNHTVENSGDSPDREDEVGRPVAVCDRSSGLTDLASSRSVNDQENGSHQAEPDGGGGENSPGRVRADKRRNGNTSWSGGVSGLYASARVVGVAGSGHCAPTTCMAWFRPCAAPSFVMADSARNRYIAGRARA